MVDSTLYKKGVDFEKIDRNGHWSVEALLGAEAKAFPWLGKAGSLPIKIYPEFCQEVLILNLRASGEVGVFE